jgi:putative endonuclease
LPDLSRRESSRQKGNRGEELALRYLAKKGDETLERNYRTPHGEIDLVVRCEHALVFVEVKLGRGREFGDPREAIKPRKQAQVRLSARTARSFKDAA